jgi:SPP1 gp7 family putative phage head morphogenesis protein
MTAPGQDQQPPDQYTAAEIAVLAALAAYLATRLAVAAVFLPTRLVGRLTALGLSARAVRDAGKLALEPPLTGRGRHGSPSATPPGAPPPSATGAYPGWSAGAAPGSPAAAHPGTPAGSPMTSTARQAKADEPTMRAQYILTAAKRLTRAQTLDVYDQALRLEQTYLDQHRHAGQNRVKAAQALDEIAAKHGPWLQWIAVLDHRTTPDCRALNGRLFTIDNLPNGQIPGAVHPRCRCRAAPFFPPK